MQEQEHTTHSKTHSQFTQLMPHMQQMFTNTKEEAQKLHNN